MGVLLIVVGIACIVGGVVVLTKGEKKEEFKTVVQQTAEKPQTTEAPVADTAKSKKEEAEEKGLDFEKWVKGHFDTSKYWTFMVWRSDKYDNGEYPESNMYPDLEYKLTLSSGKDFTIAVECKYRSRFVDGKLKWSYPAQIERYKKFAKEQDKPTFVAIGVGGKPSDPAEVFVVPIDEMEGPVVTREFLKKWKRKNKNRSFYYDIKTGLLSMIDNEKSNLV